MTPNTSVRQPNSAPRAGRPVPQAFLETARARGGLVKAVRWMEHDQWRTLSWDEYRAFVERAAGALSEVGLERGERVLLMMRNRWEFHGIDLAIMLHGGTPISVYNSASTDQVHHLLTHSGATVVVAEPEFLPHFAAASGLRAIVVVGDAPADGQHRGAPVVALTGLLERARPFDVGAAATAVNPDEIATIIYTSGTTGPPKGVQLSHRNLAWLMECLRDLTGPLTDKRMIEYGPMAHIAERGLCHYQHVTFGSEVTICPDPTRLLEYVQQVRPHMFFGAPRIFEKLRATIEAAVADDPDAARQLAEARSERLRSGADAESLVTARRSIGLDSCEIAAMGAAPIPPELIEYFASVGVSISEAYGMTESTGMISWDPFELRAGSVGRPVPGVEIRIADDGEILTRGGNVFAGYLHDPEQTAATIDADGWLHTGDIGTLDADGYLRIVDRKKDIIITGGGKNVAPSNVEAALRACALIDQACVVGDGRPYLVAALVLDPIAARAWAVENGVEATDVAALASDPSLLAELARAIDDVNTRFSRPEQVKRFLVLGEEWTPDSGMLTPTFKIRRAAIAERYRDEIDALYAAPRAET